MLGGGVRGPSSQGSEAGRDGHRWVTVEKPRVTVRETSCRGGVGPMEPWRSDQGWRADLGQPRDPAPCVTRPQHQVATRMSAEGPPAVQPARTPHLGVSRAWTASVLGSPVTQTL